MKKVTVLFALLASLCSFSQELTIACDLSLNKGIDEASYEDVIVSSLNSVKIMGSRLANVSTQLTLLTSKENGRSVLDILIVKPSLLSIGEVVLSQRIPLNVDLSLDYQTRELSVTCSSL